MRIVFVEEPPGWPSNRTLVGHISFLAYSAYIFHTVTHKSVQFSMVFCGSDHLNHRCNWHPVGFEYLKVLLIPVWHLLDGLQHGASNNTGEYTHSSYVRTSAPNSNELLEQQKLTHTHCIWCGLDKVLWHKCHSMVTLLGHKVWNLVISHFAKNNLS